MRKEWQICIFNAFSVEKLIWISNHKFMNCISSYYVVHSSNVFFFIISKFLALWQNLGNKSSAILLPLRWNTLQIEIKYSKLVSFRYIHSFLCGKESIRQCLCFSFVNQSVHPSPALSHSHTVCNYCFFKIQSYFVDLILFYDSNPIVLFIL